MRRLAVLLLFLAGCTSSGDPSVSPSASPRVRALRTPLEMREVMTRMAGACNRPYKPAPGGLVATFEGSECLVLAPPALSATHVARIEALRSELTGEWVVSGALAPEQVRAFEELTGRLQGKRLAITVERDVLAAPTIAEPISDGSFEIAMADEAAARSVVARLTG